MKSIDDWLIMRYLFWKEYDSRSNLKVKEKIIGEGDKAILMFPYWTGKSSSYNRLIKKLGTDNYSFYLYDYPKEIITKDPKVALKYMNKVIRMSSKRIKELKKKNTKEIIIIGTSLGSQFALKLANQEKVNKIILNMLIKNNAEALTKSPAFFYLRKKFKKKKITNKQIIEKTQFISPDNNIKKISKNTKVLIMASKKDIFCPYKELKPLINKMKKKGIDVEVHVNHFFGHIISMLWNLKKTKRITRFIKNQTDL